MKSPAPDDPCRLTVHSIRTSTMPDYSMRVHLVLDYQPWEQSSGQDPIFEQIGALTCVRDLLQRGGMDESW